ncbi:MAG: hypothetical protein IH586_21965 [Anaerolineaceae bacterium]|nr:hypothetical protein [Anaerolineaceae bacterium]
MSEDFSRQNDPESSNQYQKPAWIGGAILILIGFIFLLRNVTGFSLNNWWALFILIPAIGSFGRAISAYQTNGRLSAPARRALISGLVLTFIAAVFLFNLDFGSLWPVFLILGGIGLLLNALIPG